MGIAVRRMEGVRGLCRFVSDIDKDWSLDVCEGREVRTWNETYSEQKPVDTCASEDIHGYSFQHVRDDFDTT